MNLVLAGGQTKGNSNVHLMIVPTPDLSDAEGITRLRTPGNLTIRLTEGKATAHSNAGRSFSATRQ